MRWIFLLLISSCAILFESEVPAPTHKRLCFLGDTGRDSTDQRLVAKALLLEKCHGIFFVGDIIYKKGLKSAADPLFKERFLNYYEELARHGNRPQLYVVLGNHDHSGSVAAWKELAQRHSFIFFPELYWQTRLGSICVTGVDSDFQQYKIFPPWKTKQEEFMGVLKFDGCARKIVIAHHFVHTSGRRKGLPVAPAWQAFYEKWIAGKYDYFVAGHDHILSFEGDDRGTWHFISGAGGRPERAEKPGYLVLDVEDEAGKVMRARLKRINWGKIQEQVLQRRF